MANEQEIGKLVIRLVADVKAIKTGLTDAQKSIKDFTEQGKKSSRDFQSSLAGIKAQYLMIAAAAYSTYRAIMTTMDWAKIGAQAQQAKQSFETLSKSLGINGRVLIDEMKRVSGVWVDETNVMVKAQRLLAEGVSSEDLINLTKASRVAAKMMGVEVSDAFDRVSEAVITLRTRGLKAAFPMDVTEVTEKYARSLGTVAKYLDESGQRQAILNEIIRQSIEKQKLLGDSLVPNNYDKVQKFNSALTEAKEILGVGIVETVMLAVDALGVLLIPMEKTIEAIARLKGLQKSVFLGFWDFISGAEKPKTIETEEPGLLSSRGKVKLKEDMELLKSHGKEYETIETKRRTKSGIDERKLTEDLTKFRLANEEQRIVSQSNIEKMGLQIRRTQEITERKKSGEDVVMLELEWDKRMAQAEYEGLKKNLGVRRRAEIDEAIISGMDVADVKRKFATLEKEAAQKLAADLAEIEAKKALSFEALTGMTEQELQKRLEYSRALREGDLDDAMRAKNVQEALEARLQDQIIKNQIEENQFAMTKEDRLRKEININVELLTYAQERLSLLSEEDDAWISASGQVEGYKNKLRELNSELDRQTASFEQLAVLGLKKYSVSLKDDLINSMENLVPRTIDLAGNAFKTFFNDIANRTKSTSEAFKDLAKNFGQSVMDMIIDIGLLIIKMEILKALNISQPTGGTGSGTGGTVSLIGTVLSWVVGLFQSGGEIRGPSGTDKVPIRATAGEYMQPVPSVKYYGIDVMEKLRRREIPRDALVALSSGIPQGPKVKPSFMMEQGGIVSTPSAMGDEKEKKTEITLINVVDQREMDSWAASARGQNAIINVISSRADTVRKVLQ